MPPQQRTLTVWQGQVPFRVHVAGSGPAVMFLHGPWGLKWRSFLDALTGRFTVYAPEHPGTTPGDPDAIRHIDSLWDLVLCYDEMLDRLGLSEVMLIGHSFGGMVACEIAAARPSRIRRMALIDPIGLWKDDAPVTNWMLLSAQDLPRYVFRDVNGPAAKALFAIPDDLEDGALARTNLTWAMGSTGKFIWPIPDKGLRKRIHRIEAHTLLIWGAEDRLVPFVYAEEFSRRLPKTRIEVVKEAGHAPHMEHPESVAALVEAFFIA
jgi:pimeloyl-ACP methyl ester carboxylesterase